MKQAFIKLTSINEEPFYLDIMYEPIVRIYGKSDPHLYNRCIIVTTKDIHEVMEQPKDVIAKLKELSDEDMD